MTDLSEQGSPVTSIALVSYLPDPFASFLDGLRSTLEHHSSSSAHVTVLPPRPLVMPVEQTWLILRHQLEQLEPIELELGEVEVFFESKVIHLSIRSGHQQLVQLHDKLHTLLNQTVHDQGMEVPGQNIGIHTEPFLYHPHVTLAKDLAEQDWVAGFDFAKQRWNQFGLRSVQLNSVCLVESGTNRQWSDRGNLLLRKFALS